MTLHQLFRVQFLALAFTILPQNAVAQDVILGVLEEHKGHYVREPNYRTVRAVFQKTGAGWHAFRSDCGESSCLKTSTSEYPAKVKWRIAFNGKQIGHLTSRTPKDFAWYASVGEQEIVSSEPIPSVGVRSPEFGGFTDETVYRPLIATSRDYFKDPDDWKPFSAPAKLATGLKAAFREKFPKLCRLTGPNADELKPFPYQNTDVKIKKSYKSRANWSVARLHLEAVDCTDDEGSFLIDDPWFMVDPKGSITYLDSGIWLVDAGDYDNDGKSELVFSIDRENRGGYELFFNDFEKRVTFEFSYH